MKQRQQNAEALKKYNENHEDDIFGGPIQSKSQPTLLKPSTKTLLGQDSDSDSENHEDDIFGTPIQSKSLLKPSTKTLLG